MLWREFIQPVIYMAWGGLCYSADGWQGVIYGCAGCVMGTALYFALSRRRHA